MAIAEAICLICGATVWFSVKDAQTASQRAVCEDCEANPELMKWWEEQNHAARTTKPA